ncbi:MAG: hypothetical protein ACE5JP_07695, partial [Candidatus Bipolaricaulia bacterium]
MRMRRLRGKHLTGEEDRGSALVVTFFVLLLITLLGIGYFSISLNSHRFSSLTQDSERSLYIAKAGINRATQYIAAQQGDFASATVNAPSWVPSPYQLPGYLLANEGVPDDQMVGAEVFIIKSEAGTYQILSQGEFQGARRILRQTLIFFASAVDRYFSTAVAADEDGGIQTTGSVTINGDILLLPELPSIIAPNLYDEDHSGETLSSGGTLSDNNGDLTRPTTYLYDGINLNGNVEVVIDGDVRLFVNGNVTIKGGAELGRCADAGDISDTGDCSLILYVLGAGSVTIEVQGTSEVRGVIYAPQITIIASSGTPAFYGALVGF